MQQKSDPYFLTTVSIPSGGHFSEVTRLKLAVFDVRDRDKEEVLYSVLFCIMFNNVIQSLIFSRFILNRSVY